MAFIPDDVTIRQRELSPNARIVYQAHCRYRRHKYRVSFATNEEIAAEYGMSVGSVRNAMTELKRAGWIAQVAHYTELLVGDFHPVDKDHPRRDIPAGPLFRRAAQIDPPRVQEAVIQNHETVNSDHETVISNHETMIGDHETMIPNHETMISNHETVIAQYKDRARVSSHTSHTPAHTPAPAPPGEPPPALGKSVCVRVSNYSLHELTRYAKAHALGGGWVSVALDTGKWDAQVEEWLRPVPAERHPAALLNPKDCPDCSGTNYCYPQGPSGGVARCKHPGLYAGLAERAQAEARGSPAACG